MIFIMLIYNSSQEIVHNIIDLLSNKKIILVENSENEQKKINNCFISKIKNNVLSPSERYQNLNSTIHLIQPTHNTGYSGGMNLGMKKAEEDGHEWFILMNDDIDLTKKGVETFESELAHLPPGIYGPETGIFDKKRWTTILNNTENCDYVSGSFIAIHSSVYAKTKGFDEHYFMYYEDADICVRAKKIGFPVKRLAVDGIHHSPVTKNQRSNLKEYYLARNHLYFVFHTGPWMVKIHEAARLPKTMFEHYKQKNRYALMGIIDALMGKKGQRSDIAVEA
jgi:GT2 family glycosyltransferase